MELFLLVDIVNKVNRLSEGEIEVGTVETLAPTSDATASITGTFPLQYLNLGLPRGVQGEPGPKGAKGEKGEKGDPLIDGTFGIDEDGVIYLTFHAGSVLSPVRYDTDGIPYMTELE